MTHEEALNMILAHACVSSFDNEDDTDRTIELEACCVTVTLKVSMLGNEKYEIREVTID